MKLWLVGILAAGIWPTHALAANDKALELCESIVLKAIKSPSTYKKFEEATGRGARGPYAQIEFDSQNGFGALIRSTAQCYFTIPKLSAEEKAACPECLVFTMNGLDIDGQYRPLDLSSPRILSTETKM